MSVVYWHWWSDGVRAPAMNMAVDECLLAEAGGLGGRPLVRVYGWEGPAVSIGYAQRFASAPTRRGQIVVRRPTGGGIVHHDRDLTYTLVIPAGHSFAALDRVESYRLVHRAVIRLLAGCGIRGRLAATAPPVADRAAMQCFVSPAPGDVMCDAGKAAGAAQRRTRDGILHQGSILLAPAGLERSVLADRLQAAFAAEFGVSWHTFSPPDSLLSAAAELAVGKYADAAWTRRK